MESVLNNSGSGSGSGSGYGYGYGSGETIASVNGHEVRFVHSFGVLEVGCEVHTIREWRRRWRDVATKHDVHITQAEVDSLLELTEGGE